MAQTHALTRTAAAWPRGPLAIAAIVAAIAAIYWPTVRDLAGLGQRDDGQYLLVVGAFLFMVWGAREALERLPIRPSYWGLAALGVLAVAWLLGQLALVRVVTDASVVAMIPAAVLALLGAQWVRALAFPLAFLLLAIPIEQPLAPVLAGWTADVVIRLLESSGISVHREGAFFSISSGDWAVADTCSGMQYLTSCLVVSLFFAYTQFRSSAKRAAFIAGAAALAVVGNWLRAFLTVLIAHLSDNRFLRDEHAMFGWYVYGVLFVLYVAAWWRFREAPQKREAPGRTQGVFPARFAMLVALVLVIAPLIAIGVTRPARQAIGDLRIAESRGWTSASNAASNWTPLLHNPTRQQKYSFRQEDRHIDLVIGWFQQETWDSKLVSLANRLVEPETGRWVLARQSGVDQFPATASLVASPDARVLIWQWYWVDGVMSGDPIRIKLAQLLGRLLRGRAPSAWIAISTPITERAPGDLEAFARDMGPALSEALTQTSASSPR